MCVSIFYTTFYTFVGAPVNLQGNQFYIFIFSFVLAGHVDHEEHNTYSLFFLLAGHVDHEEHLYRQPGRVGHVPLRLYLAPHPGGSRHQVLEPGTGPGVVPTRAGHATTLLRQCEHP